MPSYPWIRRGLTDDQVGLVVGEMGVGIVVRVAGVPGSEGVTRVVIVAVGGTGVGTEGVAVRDGVPGIGTEGSTMVVAGSTGGMGITMLTGGGDGIVEEIIGVRVVGGRVTSEVVVTGVVPCVTASVVDVEAGVPVAIGDVPVPWPVPVVESCGWVPDWLSGIPVVGPTCVEGEVPTMVVFSAPGGIVPEGLVHPADARRMKSIATMTGNFIEQPTRLHSTNMFLEEPGKDGCDEVFPSLPRMQINMPCQ